MKKVLALLFLLCAVNVSAQDVIVKKDGATIICRVVDLNASEVIYKKWSDLNGVNYVIDRSLVASINYESGKKDNLSEADNQFLPGNQNDGTQQYNDRALLELDAQRQGKSVKEADNDAFKKANAMKKSAWIGGLLIGAGTLVGAVGGGESGIGIGCAICAVGAIWTISSISISNHYKKKAMELQSTALYEQEFDLGNGTSFTAGVDMLQDNLQKSQTLGLGFRYNF